MNGRWSFCFIRREILYFSLGFAVLTPLVSAGIMLVRKIPAKIGVPAKAGPSATISPSLFDFGVDCIAGFYITDIDLARSMVSQAAHREIFRSGNRITLFKEGIPKRT